MLCTSGIATRDTAPQMQSRTHPLGPWFLSEEDPRRGSTLALNCAWPAVLACLAEVGPCLWVVSRACGDRPAAAFAAALVSGRNFALMARVDEHGVEECLRWTSPAHGAVQAMALPSSDWRPCDRLARTHASTRRFPVAALRRAEVVIPVCVGADLRLQLRAHHELSGLDREQCELWQARLARDCSPALLR